MSRYVSIDEVTATAMTVIKSADNMDRNIWKQWIFLCALDLGIADDEIKVVELYPEDYIVALPSDCRQIIEVSLWDSSNTQLTHKFRTGKRRLQQNRNITDTTTSTQELFLPVDVSNDQSNLYLGTNGGSVAMVAVRYFAYPLDENNVPMVREEDVMACVYFIRYMQALREDDNRSKIAQDQITYFRESDRARARKKMSSMTPDKARSIMFSLMKVVPNFNSINDY